jgi:hypothetical protein
LHASYANAERRVILERPDGKAMNLKLGRVLRLAGRWISEHIERFPIPIEEKKTVSSMLEEAGRRLERERK